MIPFNNLSLIHRPLLNEFVQEFEECVLTSDFVLGTSVDNLESLIASSELCKFCVTVNSGTSALELVLRALELTEGDEIILPAMTFSATAFAVHEIGGKLKICDVDPITGIMDLSNLTSIISSKTKAVIFVSLHGRIDGLKDIHLLCKSLGIPLIVDGAQSQGATDFNVPIARECDAYTLSFYPGKNLGALGEGGAVCTNNEDIAVAIRRFRNWGSNADRYHSETWGVITD